ncbi:MAG: 50S ribosomal protein L30 [Clostridiales bacterium]|nr:50S ribosomal protein L30 [Clostridiales bacterium]
MATQKTEKIKITLTASLIAAKPNQKATAKSLGLNRIGDVTEQNNDASVLGKVKIISHLVKVENA